MLCRIADKTLAAEPVTWPGIAPSGGTGGTGPRFPLVSQPAAGAASANSAELEQRLADLDHRRQLEVAEARRAGLQDGLRQGRDESAAELQKGLDQLARALDQLAQQKRKIRHEAEGELVKLALAIARRILHRELSTDPSSIEGIVHAALQKLQHREASRVRVYPAVAAAVRAALERIGSRASIEVISDAGLEAGAILFETSLGELDASIETQLQEIQRGFADRLAIR